jgi:hypothetical protein
MDAPSIDSLLFQPSKRFKSAENSTYFTNIKFFISKYDHTACAHPAYAPYRPSNADWIAIIAAGVVAMAFLTPNHFAAIWRTCVSTGTTYGINYIKHV